MFSDEILMARKMMALLEATDELRESDEMCRKYILLSVREDASKFKDPDYKRVIKNMVDERLNKKVS